MGCIFFIFGVKSASEYFVCVQSTKLKTEAVTRAAEAKDKAEDAIDQAHAEAFVMPKIFPIKIILRD